MYLVFCVFICHKAFLFNSTYFHSIILNTMSPLHLTCSESQDDLEMCVVLVIMMDL